MPQAVHREQRVASQSQRHDNISSNHNTHSAVILPFGYQLTVTTCRGVHTWDMSGVSEIFQSGSAGIVASKKVAGDNGMLAVADSQVVILHDINKGMQKSYRLKGSEGQIRLLRYASREHNLFYTTTLQNSVQAFSLKHSKLLDPHDTHPSPPSVFTLSCDSCLLLSTSNQPPTIHLRSLVTNIPPVLLRPRCSSSAVVAATFHPEHQSIFLLAFADGAIAVYDASKILRRNGQKRDSAASPAGGSGEIAALKALHTPTTRFRSIGTVDDPGTGQVNVTANPAGITSVALLPGYKATAVTVGADGKCCVVDFTQPFKNRAILLKSWHLRRPATCVSVIHAKNRPIEHQQIDGPESWVPPSANDYYIAIGREDGKVLLFDLDGKSLGSRVLEPSRTRIIDLEWSKMKQDPEEPKAAKPAIDDAAQREAAENDGAKKMRRRAMTTPLEQDALFDFTTPGRSMKVIPVVTASAARKSSATTHSKVISPVLDLDLSGRPFLELPNVEPQEGYFPRPSGTRVASRPLATQEKKRSLSTAAPHSDKDTPSENVAPAASVSPISQSQSSATPPIPPRPSIKPGGRLYMRRAQKAREAPVTKEDVIIVSSRHASGGSSGPYHCTSTASLPRSKVLMGPRPLRRRSPTASLQAKVASAHASLTSRQSSPNILSPLSNGSVNSHKMSAKSFEAASIQFRSSEVSQASNDTIVDWSPAILRDSVPTVTQDQSSAIVEPTAKLTKLIKGKGKEVQTPKRKAKGHVSLPSQDATSSENTICNWPKYKTPAANDATTPSLIATGQAAGERDSMLDSATAIVLASGDYSTPHKPSRDARPVSSAVPAAATASAGDRAAITSPSTMITKESHLCSCGAEIRNFLEEGLAELRIENERRAKGMVEEVRAMFEEQKRWVLVELDGSEEEERQ